MTRKEQRRAAQDMPIHAALVAGQVILDQPKLRQVVGEEIAREWLQFAAYWPTLTPKQRRASRYRFSVESFFFQLQDQVTLASDPTRKAMFKALAMGALAVWGAAPDHIYPTFEMAMICPCLYANANGAGHLPMEEQHKLFAGAVAAKLSSPASLLRSGPASQSRVVRKRTIVS